LVRPVAFSLVSWGFDVSVTFLTFVALGYSVPVDKVLIVYASTGTLQTFGVSIVGFTEVVMSGFYTVLGIPPALSLAVTLLARVVTLWFKLAVSYAAFQWIGVEILTDKKVDSNKEQNLLKPTSRSVTLDVSDSPAFNNKDKDSTQNNNRTRSKITFCA
jgi:hypothetical protein